MKKSSVVIRMGANHNTVTVDGKEFDRTRMSSNEQGILRGLLVQAKKDGRI